MANSLSQASDCYANIDINKSIDLRLKAVKYYLKIEAWISAACHLHKIAEIHEDLGNIRKSVEYYLNSIQLYENYNDNHYYPKCKIRICNSRILTYLYAFPELIDHYQYNDVLKWSAKDLFVRIGLTYLNGNGLIHTKNHIQKYKDINIAFSNQEECVFLEQLIKAIETHDIDLFTNTVNQYNNTDKWIHDMLLEIHIIHMII